MSEPYDVVEKTIAQIHEAYRSGATTARMVTQAFLDRIEAYDRKGPALWAILVTNPEAMQDAERLDREFARTGAFIGPLHGIPVLIKDNYDVAGLQTTGGSAALKGWKPSRDATIVSKLRAAGAIILAKTTMSEWARGGFDNINSVLPSFARNPYNTAHATGGSSGGTGSGLAASFGVVGLGSDTWGSIRNPSSNNALVGLRPSWGLVSRAGMIGLYDARDTAGPMARTLEDLVIVLDVIALLDRAVADLRRAGAIIIDPFEVPDFGKFPAQHHPLSEVRAAVERYLSTTGDEFPKSLAEVVASEKFHPLHEVSLRATAIAPAPGEDPIVSSLEASEALMRTAYDSAMSAARLDAFVLPVANHPPRLNGDRNVTSPGATTWIASGLHWPAAVIPMGYTYEDLPSGLQVVGRPWSETPLLEIAYSYEQCTRHRRPPITTP